jgi:PAS domain S-box-containing protein
MRQVDNVSTKVQHTADPAGDATRFSPLRFLFLTIGGIFLAEVIAMAVLLYFRTLPYYLLTLMDATIMILLIFPVVYYVSLRPLLLHTEKRKQAEKSLRAAYEEMELRVQVRTHDLSLANSELEEEIQVRRRAEAALSRAQEIAHLGSWELDLVNNRLAWSDEVYRIFGLHPQEFSASYEAFLEVAHPDDRALIDDAYSGSVREGKDGYEIEHRVIRRSSGEIRYVHEKCEHFRNETGQIVRSVGMVHDITERKQAEEAVRAARDQLELRVQERTEELAIKNKELLSEIAEREKIERQLRIQTTAMEAAASGMVITDRHGNIEWTNPAMTQISGYAADEMIGQHMRLFRSGKHDVDFYQQMWETILPGKVWHGETTNRRKDGNFYVEEQTITPVRDGNDQISHFIAIKQDVTERKLMYAQLEESNRQLTSISRLEHQQRLLAEGLVESSVVLNMNLELDSLLDHIFEQTRRTIPYLIADIVLIRDGVVHVARQWGFENHPEAKTLSFDHGDLPIHKFPIWEIICLTRSTKLIPDTSLEDKWDPYFGMNLIRSYLGAPLIYGDQVIGIINLCSDEANAFGEVMANNLKAFAASAAVAIQNARLYKAEQQNRKVAEILSQASVALSQTLDIQRVMETILDYIQLVLPVDAALLILSEGNDQYRIRCVRASEEQSQLRNLLNQSIDLLNEPVIKPFFEKHTSTLIRDSHELERWDPPAELAGMRSWLGIPLISTGKTMGMVVTANLQADFFNEDQVELAEAVVGQATVALQNAWLFEQVRSGRQRLQLLSRHLVEIQENERKYIARELHDETSQALTSLKLGLHAIEQSANDEPAIAGQVANLKALADEILGSLHRLAMNLRPASLDHLGLVEALTSLVQSTEERSQIVVRFKSLGADQRNRLNEDIESSVYRIVQESLTNIVRHAKATCADVILEWQEDHIMIIVEDDGVGIDLSAARTTGQLGLVGIQERAEMHGGRLLIDSNPNAGTTLVVEIPYAH